MLIRRRSTLAWPLTWAYVALVVYASLYPFGPWRDQGLSTWSFLAAPWPKYWGAFDVWANIWGYGPLGFLAALSAMRMGLRRQAGWLAVLGSAALSLLMEGLQSYLPVRVPSVADFGLNTCGAALGALLASGLERMGAIDRWSRFRERWFVGESRGALVLLALWPFALLFPAAVPLGLGQVFERFEAALARWLDGTPFLAWLPVRDLELQPLAPGAEFLSVALGALVPCLLAYSVMRSLGRRLALALVLVVVGIGATALSTALTWGPVHTWNWLTLPVRLGLAAGLALAALLVAVPRRGCAALVMLAVVVHLSLLNPSPTGAYFAQTLQTWEQGRFIRFHGLAQWLGWLWPYGVLLYALVRVSRGEPGAGRAQGRT